MDDKVFDSIAEHVIKYLGEELRKKYQNSRLGWKDDWQDGLRISYEFFRRHIRRQMYSRPDLYNKDERIDRHKVAAAFACAIMEERPLVAGSEKPSIGARLANEALAFLSGVRIVQRFLVEHYSRSKPEIAERIANSPVSFPPVNVDNYPVHAYKALHNACHAGCVGLNVFILSNLYFLIEAYHLKTLGIGMSKPQEGK